jgi:hypothetical protein
MASSRIIVLYWGSGISMRMIDRGHFSYTDSPICGEIENMVIDFSNYKGQHREEKACFRHIIGENGGSTVPPWGSSGFFPAC